MHRGLSQSPLLFCGEHWQAQSPGPALASVAEHEGCSLRGREGILPESCLCRRWDVGWTWRGGLAAGHGEGGARGFLGEGSGRPPPLAAGLSPPTLPAGQPGLALLWGLQALCVGASCQLCVEAEGEKGRPWCGVGSPGAPAGGGPGWGLRPSSLGKGWGRSSGWMRFIPQWGSGADWLGPAAHHSSEGPVICLQSCCPAGFGGTDP